MAGLARTGGRVTDKLLRIADVMERTALSRSYIYRLIQRGAFPAQLDLGVKCSRWLEADIANWIASRRG